MKRLEFEKVCLKKIGLIYFVSNLTRYLQQYLLVKTNKM